MVSIKTIKAYFSGALYKSVNPFLIFTLGWETSHTNMCRQVQSDTR